MNKVIGFDVDSLYKLAKGKNIPGKKSSIESASSILMANMTCSGLRPTEPW
jgi:hypothetical protein